MSSFTTVSSLRRFRIAASMWSQEYSSEGEGAEGGPGMKTPRNVRSPRDLPTKRQDPVRAARAIEVLPEAERLAPLDKGTVRWRADQKSGSVGAASARRWLRGGI